MPVNSRSLVWKILICFSSPCWDALSATCSHLTLLYVTAVGLNDACVCVVVSRKGERGGWARTHRSRSELYKVVATRDEQNNTGETELKHSLPLWLVCCRSGAGLRWTPPLKPQAAVWAWVREEEEEAICCGGWLWPWCASEVRAAAWELMWWAGWWCPGTTGWNCAGESSSEPSSSPAAARGGNDPRRATQVR